VEYKHITIEVVDLNNDNYALYVVEQTHRGYSFGEPKNGGVFKASNGVTISSGLFPGRYEDLTGTFVQGANKNGDNYPIMVSGKNDLERITFAIKEYNKTYSINNVKLSNIILERSIVE
jgi:hypothetical protein